MLDCIKVDTPPHENEELDKLLSVDDSEMETSDLEELEKEDFRSAGYENENEDDFFNRINRSETETEIIKNEISETERKTYAATAVVFFDTAANQLLAKYSQGNEKDCEKFQTSNKDLKKLEVALLPLIPKDKKTNPLFAFILVLLSVYGIKFLYAKDIKKRRELEIQLEESERKNELLERQLKVEQKKKVLDNEFAEMEKTKAA